MIYSKPVTEIIKTRFSCRTYLEEPIPPEKQQLLKTYIQNLQPGPFATGMRFDLLAAEDPQRKELRGLGTYGNIKGASGFIVGAIRPGVRNLEDYGFSLEQIVLYATDLGLGTCWLGGGFTRSSFAKKIALAPEEHLPAILSIGIMADEGQVRENRLRQLVSADTRLPWEELFFDGKFGLPLTRPKAGRYAAALEDLRLAPSASNKQPWRIIQDGDAFHFYLQRTKGYREQLVAKLLRVEDLQRVDMGIAMCHFELSAAESGLKGKWMIQEPPIAKPDAACEYTVSWSNL